MKLECGTVDQCFTCYFRTMKCSCKPTFPYLYGLFTCILPKCILHPWVGKCSFFLHLQVPRGVYLTLPSHSLNTVWNHQIEGGTAQTRGCVCIRLHCPLTVGQTNLRSSKEKKLPMVLGFACPFFFVIFEDEMNSLHYRSIVILLLFALKVFLFRFWKKKKHTNER